MQIQPTKYLKYIFPMFGTHRTKEILKVNPTLPTQRADATEIEIQVYQYNHKELHQFKYNKVADCAHLNKEDYVTWINIDGIRKIDVENICQLLGIHALITEDILSQGQRPKMDEIGDHLSCVLNMLYYNPQKQSVETEQITIVLGNNMVISFQEDASRDVFNPLRDKLKITNSKIRSYGADYLCYTMLDLIVDNYFTVMENLGESIESTEEEIIKKNSTKSLAKINALRKEMIVLKRNIAPCRELVNGIIRSDSDLLKDDNTKYFKDVYDHILQANDLSDNYRDMIINLQDLYVNQSNLKMNEVMKVMAVVTCLLAPATVIGGIFGMNFNIIGGYINNHYGFLIAVTAMVAIPLLMIFIFKKRGWF
jgi:magnesium transporter